MPAQTDRELRRRLRRLGLSSAALNAAWPAWWSAGANGSASAKTELAFTVARRLGLDPRSLIEDSEEPRFLWRAEARFKRISNESDLEREGITSFGRSLATLLIEASPNPAMTLLGETAVRLRAGVLRRRPFVGLPDLLAVAWASGVAVVDTRVFPWDRKRVAALTVSVGDRSAVAVVKEARYPASAAFYVGHELGHVALGHLGRDSALVDLEDEHRPFGSADPEEQAADEFALELLTGEPRPTIRAVGDVQVSGRELAASASGAARGLQIDPGVIAQVFGFSTGHWATVGVAMRTIYRNVAPAWEGINQVARGQLSLSRLSDEAADFVDAVLGGPAA